MVATSNVGDRKLEGRWETQVDVELLSMFQFSSWAVGLQVFVISLNKQGKRAKDYNVPAVLTN